MTGLLAEMGHVDNRRRIIGNHGKCFALGQALETFSGFQNWKRTQKSGGVEHVIRFFHNAQISAMFHSVHKDVTVRRGDDDWRIY